MGFLVIAVPEALREKLGPDGARALAELLNEASVQTRGDVIEIAATRFEQRLAEELGRFRADMHAEFGTLRNEMQAELGLLRKEMQSEVGGLRAEMHSELGTLRNEMHAELANLRNELQSEVGGLRGAMHSELGKLRAEMGAFEGRIMRWMFVFWIGQIGALLGILFAFFRP